MDNKIYRSKIGEERSFIEWKLFAISFYQSLKEKGHTDLPDNWFSRLSKTLKLEEIQ